MCTRVKNFMVNMRVIKAKNAIMTLVIIAFLIMLIIKIFLFGKDKRFIVNSSYTRYDNCY